MQCHLRSLPLLPPTRTSNEVAESRFSGYICCHFQKPKIYPTWKTKVIAADRARSSSRLNNYQIDGFKPNNEGKQIQKSGKREHHLWKRKASAGSGWKAQKLIKIMSDVPSEKEAVYGALNKWIAWEIEFPAIAAAKALRILRQRSQWRCVIQVAKWMLSKGQGVTMATYDTLLLAFDMDHRVDEADSLWNMIVHTHTRSIPKRLFSRIISLYDHHNETEKLIEVFADMEELGVRPDEDTVRKVARAFRKLGLKDKQNLVLHRYLGRWKYVHFNGERVKVRRYFGMMNKRDKY